MVGGIWQLQALQRPLPEVFSAIGNGFTARTDDSELRQRRVSLTIYYRHGLSPEERVSILGKHLGVTAIFSDYVDSTETQFIFEQSGPIPARESFEPAPFKREELDDGRMRYVVASMPLIRLVRYAWWRSTDNRPGVYTWPASPGTSGVWKQLVDADFTTDGTWGQNASYLRERFGVIYETREKLLRTRFIELSQ
jgi:hypothetical protein